MDGWWRLHRLRLSVKLTSAQLLFLPYFFATVQATTSPNAVHIFNIWASSAPSFSPRSISSIGIAPLEIRGKNQAVSLTLVTDG